MLEELKNAARGLFTGPKKNAPGPPAPTEPPAKKTAAKAQEITTELLLAWQASRVNPTLLTAYRPGTDPTNPNCLVSVTVRSNRLFMPHMRLRVRLVSEGRYDLVGPLPRWKGKW